MSNVDYQITILEAYRSKRAIQLRRRKSANVANPWIMVKPGDLLLNFDRFEYRIAPVTQETWLVYDTHLNIYVGQPYGNPASAAFDCNSRNTPAYGNRWQPVKVKPCEP